MIESINSKAKLNNGVEMPFLGLGTYAITSYSEIERSILSAYDNGYRLIDSARMYHNEELIGEVIRKNSLPRKNLFITSKLWTNEHGYENASHAIDNSLKNFNMDYIDLYLIHWPSGGKILETWNALVEALNDGKCRAVGVSNFNKDHLKEILDNSEIVPAVNQFEFSPFYFERDLLSFCDTNNILVEAYSPLVKGNRFENETIKKIAAKYSKSPAQILIRWALQHEVIAIPKSSNPERIAENADVFDFEISQNDMDELDLLG